ncbi:MAG: methionyl-tRNA formyltransferase, partial [Magnetovibrio sp.]|nr:methionyl-tRNA formyltransferase [Magnetovibrio sp.]
MSEPAKLKLIFMGTPDFSVVALKAILQAGHDVLCVYSQPPRKSGRGQKLHLTPVHEFARSQGIEVRTPTSLKDETEQQAFADLNCDLAVVVAYGLILPPQILAAPQRGCINIHASLLPRWRGAAPIQRAIMAGDTETGVGIMQMAEGLDTGDVLADAKLPIGIETTTGILHDQLADTGAELMIATIGLLAAGDIHPKVQPEDGITYAKKIVKAEAAIDWSRS